MLVQLVTYQSKSAGEWLRFIYYQNLLMFVYYCNNLIKMSKEKSSESKTSMLTYPSIKPSVFCSSLESFAMHSVYPGKSLRPEADFEKPRLSQDDQDPALSNWEKWRKVHKAQQNRLTSKLDRPAQCMLMNSNLNNLYVNQEKNVLSEAANLEFCDKFRGHRNFWLTGDNFKNDGRSLGIYQTVEYRYDRSHPKLQSNSCPNPPLREYVGVPDKILEEKILSGDECSPSSKSKWDRSQYVKEKEEALRDKLQTIRQHKPDVSEIIVVGRSVKNETGTMPGNLEPDGSFGGSCKTETSTYFEPSAAVSSLSVEIDGEIIPAESGLWVVFFGEQEVGKILEKCIVLKNSGNSCVKYCWEVVFPSWTDCELPLVHVKLQNRTFFFDKNDGCVLPGQEKLLKFQFKSETAGVFCEKWELHFCRSADTWLSAVIDLQAVAVNASDESLKDIESYIDSCTKFSIARKSVEQLLKRNRLERPSDLPYDWKFFEEEIFLLNNPELFYDNRLVHKLKNVHHSIAKGPWDYSVSGLRNRLMERTVLEGTAADLETLTSTVYDLMKPNYFKCYLEKDRYQTVHDLLCCFVNQVEVESVHLQIAIGLPVRLLDLKNSEVELRSTSVISAKLSARMSQISNKHASKKGLQKSKSSHKNQSIGSIGSVENSSHSATVSESNESLAIKRQEYLEALFVKTYAHLSNTIDNMSAILESYDSLRKKTIHGSLKN